MAAKRLFSFIIFSVYVFVGALPWATNGFGYGSESYERVSPGSKKMERDQRRIEKHSRKKKRSHFILAVDE